MIFGILICWYALTLRSTFSTVASPPNETCLTGLMTDRQSWVSIDGRLLVNTSDALDLSIQNVNKVRDIITNIRNRNVTLRYLGFAKLNLSFVPEVFKQLDSQSQPIQENLEYMTFYGNDFGRDFNNGRKWYRAFQTSVFPNLKELDLRTCRIITLDLLVFTEMPNLEKLYLRDNFITSISSNAFNGLNNLKHLDLSRNSGDVAMDFENLSVFQPLRSLRSLDMSFTKIINEKVNVFKYISSKLEILSMCDMGINKRIDAYFFENTSLKYLDVSGNMNILSEPRTLSGLEEKLKVMYASRTALLEIDIFKGFKVLEILKLDENLITTINRDTISSLNNLKVLNLNSNKLISWFVPRMSFAPSLMIALLQENSMSVLTKEMLEDFESIDYIGLSRNIFVCDCNVRDFYEIAAINDFNEEEDSEQDYLLKKHTIFQYPSTITALRDVSSVLRNRRLVKRLCKDSNSSYSCPYPQIDGHYRIVDYDDDIGYKCLDVNKKKLVSFHQVKPCDESRSEPPRPYEPVLKKQQSKLIFLITIPIVVIPFGIFIYAMRRSLRYCFITVKNSAMLSLINKDYVINDETIFHYEVFVSYCNEDRPWVLDHLLPHLEKDCNVNVCLHERDFQVGLSILENIINCMDRSRSIMLVLSQKFLRSQWCQFEMHLAQHRLLETRREDLTLILLEEIPRKLRPTTLHYLMITKTYIVWPREDKSNEEEREIFWKRLKKGLFKVQERIGENHSLA